MRLRDPALRAFLEQLVQLPKGGAMEVTPGPMKTQRLAQQLRSHICGQWRAYLPGSLYTVRASPHAVIVTRTA